MSKPNEPAKIEKPVAVSKPQTPAPVVAKKKPKKSVEQFAKDFVIGGVAASIAKTLNAPLERVKLINQTTRGKYKGVVDCLVQLPKDEGVFAYWRGNAVNVLRYFPTQALNFAFKDYFKTLVMPGGADKYSYWSQFGRGLISGGLAGGSSLVFVYPLDLARTRMSTDLGKGAKRTYNGLGDCVKKTLKEGGFFSLYKGFAISVFGIIPYRAVYFGGYDTLKKVFLKDEKNASFWFKWAISQTNTIIAQTLVYPIDTVRRTMMLAGQMGKDGKPTKTYKSSFACCADIVRNRGLVGLFRGALANTYRATGGALCIVMYDVIKVKLKLDVGDISV